MPPYDYSKIITKSNELTRRFGRTITLKTWNKTPLDPSMPWRGTAPTVGDPAEENVTDLELVGVFIPPGAVRVFDLTALGEGTKMEDLIAFSEQIIITFPGQNDIRLYKTVNDGTADWGITSIQVLKPGNEQVLAYIGVRR